MGFCHEGHYLYANSSLKTAVVCSKAPPGLLTEEQGYLKSHFLQV